MKYLLLYGKLTGKKPPWYCEHHKCGINKSVMKKKCAKCKYFKQMSPNFAEIVKVVR